MIAFSSFNEQAKALAFPEGEAENLETLNRTRTVNALIHLQTHVPCLRDNNINYYLTQDMVNHCGIGRFSGPRGIVQNIYSFLPNASCALFHHQAVSADRIQCAASAPSCDETALPYDPADPSGTYVSYPYVGDRFCADGELPVDIYYESADHLYHIGPAQNFFIAPKLSCGYILAIHWQGIKRLWEDADLITDDQDILMAVSKYVRAESAHYDDGDLVLSEASRKDFGMMAAQIFHRCREETRAGKPHVCLGGPDSIAGWFSPIYPDNPYIQE